MALASATEAPRRCCLEVAPAHKGSGLQAGRSAQPGQQRLQLCCSRAHAPSVRTGTGPLRERPGRTWNVCKTWSEAHQGLGGLCFRWLTNVCKVPISETWRSVLCSGEEETLLSSPLSWILFQCQEEPRQQGDTRGSGIWPVA